MKTQRLRVQVSALQQTTLYIILGPGLVRPQNPEDSAAFTVEESSGGEGGIKEKKPTGPLRR